MFEGTKFGGIFKTVCHFCYSWTLLLRFLKKA